MTLSVKPFGCMPSSGVSDGVQSIITEQYPQGIFLPIETNGDGAVNVYSRVQMMLFKARLAAKAEYKAVLDEAGLTIEEVRAYLAKKRWRGSSLFYPRHGTVASQAANLAQHVVDDIKKTRTAKIIDFTKRVIARRSQDDARGARAARRRVGELVTAMLQGIMGGKLGGLTEKLRVIVHRGLQETGNEGPVLKRVREVANTVNDLLGKPIHGADDAGETVASAGPAPAEVPLQAPVVVYFDGKDHRTKTKIEELLRGRDIVFTILDVANDEAERSWVITAAKSEEFPIVVIAGTPVGGFHELTQLDVQGELKRRVFALQ